MTLIVALARDNQHVTLTGDSSVYIRRDDCSNTPVELRLGKKVDVLSDRVLMAIGGCVGLRAELRELMGARVRPDDDLLACIDALRDAVAWMQEYERPGELYEAVRGCWVPRMTVSDGLAVTLAGFMKYGGAGIAERYDNGEIDLVPSEGRAICSVATPYDVDYECGEAFSAPFTSGAINDLCAKPALEYAFSIHQILHTKYPAWVTADLHGVQLECRGTLTPAPFSFGFDDIATIGALLAKNPMYELASYMYDRRFEIFQETV